MVSIMHDSDCAVHNEPAMPNGPCDCGAGQRGTTGPTGGRQTARGGGGNAEKVPEPAPLIIDRTSHSYLLGVAQYELTECHSQRDKLRRALERIEQRANESGTGEMGLLDTIHDMHRYASEALQDEVRINRNTP